MVESNTLNSYKICLLIDIHITHWYHLIFDIVNFANHVYLMAGKVLFKCIDHNHYFLEIHILYEIQIAIILPVTILSHIRNKTCCVRVYN